MVTANARNSRRFNVSFPCQSEGIIHHYARPLSLYPPISYSQVSDHSVTGGLTNTMLLIGTPLVVTCWRYFIHSYRSWRCHSWSRFGPHYLPLFSKWLSWLKKYYAGGMTCTAWSSFPINDSSVSVLIFVESNASFMSLVQAICFYFGRNTLIVWVFMSHPRHVLCLASCTYLSSFLK